MNIPPLTRDQVRDVDRIAIEEYGVPGIVLMENAGRGAAEIIHQLAPSGLIVILCGSGNNAGDGYVIARHLQLKERDVRIVSIANLETLRGDARINGEIAEKSGIDIHVVDSADAIAASLKSATTIVDGLLGTGARGPLRGLFADAVRSANECDALRIALDIPTGLDCDSGETSEATFRAAHTITFVAPKVGFEKENADEFVGVVHVVGIGAPQKLLRGLVSRQA